MSNRSVSRSADRTPAGVRDQYARAREEQADKLFREIIEIADDASGDYVTTSDGKRIVDHENIQRSRLRVDARKWAAARLAPKKYGDRVEHDVRGDINFQPAVLVQVGRSRRARCARRHQLHGPGAGRQPAVEIGSAAFPAAPS